MMQHEGPGRLLAGAVSPSYAFLPFGTEAAQAHCHEEGGLGIWSYGNSTITPPNPLNEQELKSATTKETLFKNIFFTDMGA